MVASFAHLAGFRVIGLRVVGLRVIGLRVVGSRIVVVSRVDVARVSLLRGSLCCEASAGGHRRRCGSVRLPARSRLRMAEDQKK